jgi:hypothetical protein
MATPINAPLTSEIWHLSIDDLLEPMSAPPRLGGPGPFVINLSASSAPLSQPAKGFVAPDGAYVYQIQRTEDRRPRYRLRLGPFATEDAADAMLSIVRDVYPSALTATAEADDLKAITSMKPKPERAPAPVAAPLPRVAPALAVAPTPVAVRTPEAAPAPKAVPTPVVVPTRVAAATPMAVSISRVAPLMPVPPTITTIAPRIIPTLSAASPARTVSRPQPPPAAVSIPVLSDSVEPVRRAPAKAAPAPAPVKAAAHTPANATGLPPRQAPVPDAERPSLESTQTLRPLTPSELKDLGARWYVIQLSLSGESFDPDSLPNLDIFNEYRLYSVAGLDQGRIVHALRLGFFAEEGAAAAVASYLGGFYDKPTVKRISVAERERFRDQRVEARKDIGATGRHAVIEITGERHIRENRARIATVTPLAPAAAFAQSTGTPARRGR